MVHAELLLVSCMRIMFHEAPKVTNVFPFELCFYDILDAKEGGYGLKQEKGKEGPRRLETLGTTYIDLRVKVKVGAT